MTAALGLQPHFRKTAAQSFGSRYRTGESLPWQKYAELVASQASDKRMVQPCPYCDSANCFITDGVTVKVIDLFKLIYIEQNGAERAILSSAHFRRFLKKCPSVVNPSQRVCGRQPDQFPLQRHQPIADAELCMELLRTRRTSRLHAVGERGMTHPMKVWKTPVK